MGFLRKDETVLIVTDLDGTLLHPETYSFEPARPALTLIKEKGIPLILCSSKTRRELEVWRERLGNTHPFISENGGGIFVPKGYFQFPVEGQTRNGYTVITLGRPYSEIRRIFLEIRERLGIKARGFGDMGVEEIAHLTGLPLIDVGLAREREFDEPFIFEEGEKRIGEFLNAIEEVGLHWTQGRFYHILGDNDKGKAFEILKGLYRRAYGDIKMIGLGDNLNDLPLLQEVDYPVLVRRADGGYDTRIDLPSLIKAKGVGPEGWNEVITGILKED